MLRLGLVLAAFVLAAGADQINPVLCGEDITRAAKAVVSAGQKVRAATADCRSADKTKCVADASGLAEALSSAAEQAKRAVEDCGGKGSVCGDEITAAAEELAAAGEAGTKAADDCPKGSTEDCAADFAHAGMSVAHAAGKAFQALKDCMRHSAPGALEAQAVQPVQCAVDLAEAAAATVGAGGKLWLATQECRRQASNKTSCSSRISGMAAAFREASGKASNAASDCAAEGTACAAGIADVAAELAAAGDAGEAAAGDCTRGAFVDCGMDIEKVGTAVGHASSHVLSALKTCARKKVGEDIVI